MTPAEFKKRQKMKREDSVKGRGKFIHECLFKADVGLFAMNDIDWKTIGGQQEFFEGPVSHSSAK